MLSDEELRAIEATITDHDAVPSCHEESCVCIIGSAQQLLAEVKRLRRHLRGECECEPLANHWCEVSTLYLKIVGHDGNA